MKGQLHSRQLQKIHFDNYKNGLQSCLELHWMILYTILYPNFWMIDSMSFQRFIKVTLFLIQKRGWVSIGRKRFISNTLYTMGHSLLAFTNCWACFRSSGNQQTWYNIAISFFVFTFSMDFTSANQTRSQDWSSWPLAV